ncbi:MULTISPECIES: FtsW/RodA/SpoVE family cell cycle protein [Neobacillus]|jgi:rod shape determining protein RodA|uniref:Rod shape-determining protein RodA n=1 Tax=Neobacillus sedimentimangrovi TaxID=2699460 RepID=A0ABS8QMI3_9BACI|nr:FtsW/RodA/SpoVE family cell cycle protein [Neobacillus sedimentimangrovi]AIM16775.1 cell cycle protein [Bacillus sp. X1(2014)]MCD4839504.1 rod shape-determining protein RodA [Neobacillus sedimentimangrovi]
MNNYIKTDRFDWTLTLLLFLFFLISCVAIYSAQATGQYGDKNFVIMQVFWYIVGAVIISVSIFIDSYQYKKLAWILYGFGIFLLVTLALAPESIAPERNGSKNWFVIPGIGTIQPSEFVKIFLILALSRLIVSHQEKFIEKTLRTDFLLLLKLGLVTAVPLGLIIREDLGTALVIISILSGLILVSGISWKIIISLYGAGASLVAVIFYLVLKKPEILEKYLHVQTYQFYRIYSWIDPVTYTSGSSYHLMKSLSAIGSGLISGKGFKNGEVYIPEAHTDFIFSVIGEEYGFIGGSVVIGLYFLLIYHLIKISLDTNDHFNTYVCTGIISMITFHVFQNIGMTIQVLPITGIPLPFISYGGSSLMGNMFAMGLVYSIRYHHRSYMFSSENSINS